MQCLASTLHLVDLVVHYALLEVTSNCCAQLTNLAPNPHGNPVRHYPVPMILPWMWSPSLQFPRGYHGIPTISSTVQTSNTHSHTLCWMTTFGLVCLQSSMV